jgi:hypothetical protein
LSNRWIQSAPLRCGTRRAFQLVCLFVSDGLFVH